MLKHGRFSVFFEFYRLNQRRKTGTDKDEPKRYPGDDSPWGQIQNYRRYFRVTAEYVKWELTYENYLMDMATIPPSETSNKDTDDDDDIQIEDPENEEELKAILGL